VLEAKSAIEAHPKSEQSSNRSLSLLLAYYPLIAATPNPGNEKF
jgi:hypothetical protein